MPARPVPILICPKRKIYRYIELSVHNILNIKETFMLS